MTASTVNPTNPWDLLQQARRRRALVTLLFCLALIAETLTLITTNRSLFRSYQREIEANKQVSTLIAENRRLRGHCEPTP